MKELYGKRYNLLCTPSHRAINFFLRYRCSDLGLGLGFPVREENNGTTGEETFHTREVGAAVHIGTTVHV